MFRPQPMSTSQSPTRTRRPRPVQERAVGGSTVTPHSSGNSAERPLVSLVSLPSSSSDADVTSASGRPPRSRFLVSETESSSFADVAPGLRRPTKDFFGDDSLFVSISESEDVSFPLRSSKPDEFARIAQEKRKRVMANCTEQQNIAEPQPPPATCEAETTVPEDNATCEVAQVVSDPCLEDVTVPSRMVAPPPAPPQPASEPRAQCCVHLSDSHYSTVSSCKPSRSLSASSEGVAHDLLTLATTPQTSSRMSLSSPGTRTETQQGRPVASLETKGSLARNSLGSFSLPRSAFANDVDFVTDALRRFCVTDDDEVDYEKGTWRPKLQPPKE